MLNLNEAFKNLRIKILSWRRRGAVAEITRLCSHSGMALIIHKGTGKPCFIRGNNVIAYMVAMDVFEGVDVSVEVFSGVYKERIAWGDVTAEKVKAALDRCGDSANTSFKKTSESIARNVNTPSPSPCVH
ncbi:MAG: hypothetical protein ACXWYM_00205 [Candidatus Binatia bacterium]